MFPSGHCDWEQRPSAPGPRAREDQELAAAITAIHAQSRQTYGRPRLVTTLRTRGRRHGRRRVARLMQHAGLCDHQKGRYRVHTTNSNHDHPIALNRLAEVPKTTAPNQIWVADITYIPPSAAGFTPPLSSTSTAAKIVGWAMSETMGAAIVLQALAMAILHRDPPAKLRFHSDRGVPYAAGDFLAALAQAHLIPSMSRRGNCYDHATTENFWSTLKLELVYRRDFATHSQACAAIFDYLEAFYNRERLHSALNFLSPAAFEHQTN